MILTIFLGGNPSHVAGHPLYPAAVWNDKYIVLGVGSQVCECVGSSSTSGNGDHVKG